MVRASLVDAGGKMVLPQNLTSAAELREAAEMARNLVRECDRLAQGIKDVQNPSAPRGAVPYVS